MSADSHTVEIHNYRKSEYWGCPGMPTNAGNYMNLYTNLLLRDSRQFLAFPSSQNVRMRSMRLVGNAEVEQARASVKSETMLLRLFVTFRQTDNFTRGVRK